MKRTLCILLLAACAFGANSACAATRASSLDSNSTPTLHAATPHDGDAAIGPGTAAADADNDAGARGTAGGNLGAGAADDHSARPRKARAHSWKSLLPGSIQ